MSKPRDLVIASRSPHKVAEIREILGDVPGLRVLGLDEAGIGLEPDEDELEPFSTFEENAASKASYYRSRCASTVVADDSGIEVEALGGAPGVRTKRFAPPGYLGLPRDQANNRYLLDRLTDVPDSERGARYVCVATLAPSGTDELLSFRGEAAGTILRAERGSGGFGYDPVFYDPELGLGFAELPAAEKHARSHRGKAFRALAEHLRATASEARS